MVLGGHRSHSLTKTPPCRGPNHRFKLPDGGVGTWTEFWIKCRNKQFCRCEIPPNGQNISPAKQSSSCIGLVIPSSDKRKSHSMLLFCLSVVNCLVTRQGYFKCTCFPFYSLFPARFIFFFLSDWRPCRGVSLIDSWKCMSTGNQRPSKKEKRKLEREFPNP